MNERIKELNRQALEDDRCGMPLCEKFAELIVQEHVKVLQQEWYNLNNDKDFDSSQCNNGDIRFRAGQKAEIVVLIEKIKKHFGVK